MTDYAHDLVRRLEGGFAGKRLTAALRAEYVVFLEGVGKERAERAVTIALRTLKYRPTLFELAELTGSLDRHPAAPPKPLVLDLCTTCGKPTPCHCTAPRREVEIPAGLAAVMLDLRLPELEPEYAPPLELEYDDELDDEEPF
jgi:hypothetical protein